MDIVISIGQLIGIKLPENFNHPFAARSFLDFWTRWHITLSNWLKLYVFNPFMKNILQLHNALAWIPLYGVLAYFFTFFLVGVWHGSTAIAIFYGLILGLAAAVNKLYEVIMKKILNKRQYQALHQNRFYSYFCGGLTLNYMIITIFCLFFSFKQVASMFHLLSVGKIIVIFFAGAFILGCWQLIEDIAVQAGRWIKNKMDFYLSNAWTRRLSLALILIVLGLAIVLSNFEATRFVYQMF